MVFGVGLSFWHGQKTASHWDVSTNFSTQPYGIWKHLKNVKIIESRRSFFKQQSARRRRLFGVRDPRIIRVCTAFFRGDFALIQCSSGFSVLAVRFFWGFARIIVFALPIFLWIFVCWKNDGSCDVHENYICWKESPRTSSPTTNAKYPRRKSNPEFFVFARKSRHSALLLMQMRFVPFFGMVASAVSSGISESLCLKTAFPDVYLAWLFVKKLLVLIKLFALNKCDIVCAVRNFVPAAHKAQRYICEKVCPERQSDMFMKMFKL